MALREEESLMSAGGSYPSSSSSSPGSLSKEEKDNVKDSGSTASKPSVGNGKKKKTEPATRSTPPPFPDPSPTPSSCTKDDDKPSSSFFGIRSYLHHFYDSVALRDADQFEEFEEYRYESFAH